MGTSLEMEDSTLHGYGPLLLQDNINFLQSWAELAGLDIM